ncbi:hypothetical protein [Agrobacterium vaccinii]|uniref:hypothetical protein n=1 Tax=Agrobacterium vaccinii TaxID=2735528 RepID=UPI001E2BE1D3|nr:hypothetical protein [Agrobacterium vaccinii]UHS59830.1 hypothetical protein HRS00_23225 [Agrobacterium vaccinii]
MADDFLEDFGMSQAEHFALVQFAQANTFDDGSKLARLRTQQRYADKGSAIADLLVSFKGLRSAAGICSEIISLKQDPTRSLDWETTLEKLYGDPIMSRSRVTWLAFQAALRADAKFALEVAPARSHENTLTGTLIRGLTAECDLWASHAAGFLSRIKAPLTFESADISVGGGEQETGGDFVVIIDLEEEAETRADLHSSARALLGPRCGHQIIPIVFQAKRFVGTKANISQWHEKRGYQFNKLRKTKCASSYIFYENGDEEINAAALPIVKPVQNCKPISVEKYTPVYENSTDLATYLLWAINDPDAFPRAPTKEDAMNMVCASVRRSFRRIVFLGNTDGLRKLYAEAYRNLKDEIAEQNRSVSRSPMPEDLESGPAGNDDTTPPAKPFGF